MDLHDGAQALRQGAASATQLLDGALRCARTPAASHAYIRLFESTARATAAARDQLRGAGVPDGPLAGLPISVKDLFPVAGYAASAGAVVLPDEPAVADCTAVARLRAAGAVLVGHTNMTEFAFSGVGLNPHHGTPANPVMAALGFAQCVPGGSTSGGAVTVATGSAMAALGSDTGGSLRIPAALQGLVGFKCTARLTPSSDVVPLSPTLDTVGAITRSVRDAALMHAVLAQRPVLPSGRPLAGRTLAVSRDYVLDGIEPPVLRAFERTVGRLATAGAVVREVDLPIRDVGEFQAYGSFPAAEAYQWHRERLERDADRYDPRVRSRLLRGAAMSASDYLSLQRARRDWIGRMESALLHWDAVLTPTVPILAPPIAPLVDNDDEFFRVNALLLRNPTVVNLLDGCAISLPCQEPGDAPVGLMLWSSAMRDDELLEIAAAVEAAIDPARG